MYNISFILVSGNKLENKNHYRGHKLSMWLSLIPQLHNPGDLTDLTMRHHHFNEEAAQYYDGMCFFMLNLRVILHYALNII